METEAATESSDSPATGDPADGAGSGAGSPPEDARGGFGGWLRRAGRFVFRRPLCFGGLVGALVFFCLSLTPSLLPRGWIMQGVVSGITVAVGYGLGSAGSAILRRVLPREPSERAKRIAWRSLLVATIVLVPVSLAFGDRWQEAVRRLMEAESAGSGHWLGVIVATLVLAGVLLVVSRGIRGLGRSVIRLLDRFLPRSQRRGRLLDPLLGAAVHDGVGRVGGFNQRVEQEPLEQT
ncbi:MAG: alpha/beta-hydrolase N-terminal domain-containing protein, partial [Actinomycetota bacterium]